MAAAGDPSSMKGTTLRLRARSESRAARRPADSVVADAAAASWTLSCFLQCAEGRLHDEIQPARQSVGCVWRQVVVVVVVEGRLDARHDLLQAFRRRLERDSLRPDGDEDSLHYLRRCRRLRLRRLGLQAHQLQKAGHALERRFGHLVRVDAVEVVDKVAGDDPVQSRILWTAWIASAVLLKCQTDAAAPKHMARG